MRRIPQPFKRPLGQAPYVKPVSAQPKTGVFAQNFKRSLAPTAIGAQAMSKAAQPKMANGVVNRKLPVAPPVYRPQPVPKVLQTKSASAHGPHAVRAPRAPVAPPVYRPEQKRIAQPKNLSAADPLLVQAKFAGSVLSARAIQWMGQAQVIQRAESEVISSGAVAVDRGKKNERDDDKNQGHLVKRTTRSSSKPPPNLNRLRLSFQSSYDGVASQQLDKKQKIGFQQKATLHRPPDAPRSARYYYDFRQQVKDSFTYHTPSHTQPLDPAFVQDNGFGPPYENVTTTVTDAAIEFEDHPGFSQGNCIPEGQWLSRYEVHFRWTVTRSDAEGNGASWTSPEVVHTVECTYNEGETVQITHRAAGNFNWIVELR